MGDSGGGRRRRRASPRAEASLASPFSLYNSTVAANQAFGSDAGQGGAGGAGNPDGYRASRVHGARLRRRHLGTGRRPGGPGLVTSVSTIIALNTGSPDRLAGEPDDVEAAFLRQQHAAGGRRVARPAFRVDRLATSSGWTRSSVRSRTTAARRPPWPCFRAARPSTPAPTRWTSPPTSAAIRPRVVGAAADIGAYEFGAAAPPGGGSGGHGGGNPGGGTGGAGGGGTSCRPGRRSFR